MLYQYRFIFVIAFLGLSAALLTDRNRLPLALRGLKRVLKKGGGASKESENASTVTPKKRLLAFILILLAFVVAVI